MRCEARSIQNGWNTPCLFLYAAYDNVDYVIGHLFYRNAFWIIGVINSNRV